MIESIPFAAALILFGLIAGMLGTAYEAHRTNISCPCGLLTLRHVILHSTASRANIAAQLAESCPVCQAKNTEGRIQNSEFSIQPSAFSAEGADV